MKVVMFSSVFNHHSLPFCDEMHDLCEGDFRFVETLEEEEERRTMGYHGYNRPYVISMWENKESAEKAWKWALEADVMIAGVFPYPLLKNRLDDNKLTFLCQERMFKGGRSLVRRFKAWYHTNKLYGKYVHKSLYLLSIGKNAAKDYRSIGFFRDRAFSWAYFTSVETVNRQFMDEREVKVLFAGRLIPLKHPEYALKAISRLYKEGYKVKLEYVGSGVCEDQLRDITDKEQLNNIVTFSGAMPPENVRNHMLDADVFVFTSNSMEGWGAVVNEAMSSGCAVVASQTAGSVNTLIKDGINGLSYKNDSFEQFYEKLKQVISDSKMRFRLQNDALKTMQNEYNAAVAAKRFCTVAQAILDGKESNIYKDGIMKRL